ncbi:hypothetical protein [Cellulophaga sp. Z1A5H]|uniref:hypothetical protein n=1 Tax=Cellulophaga sp. Z1A5H TaxID=2687291 RepID=UPI0013FDF4E2|nr:hypothetical protein [Cellulophaga sp. Z1A5H]
MIISKTFSLFNGTSKMLALAGASKGLTKTRIFNNMNDELKQSLNLTGLNAQSKFTELIDDVNSNLYSFIKSE